MSINREIKGDVVVEKIDIVRATYKEAGALKVELDKSFEKKIYKIVIDLSNCKYMDSTFLGVLVKSLKFIADKGGDIKLAAAHSDAEVLLDLTRMNRVFKLYKTVDEAIADFN
ncbi:MAG: STAS domain-containing protein [Ignavibacteriaceae bacterium]